MILLIFHIFPRIDSVSLFQKSSSKAWELQTKLSDPFQDTRALTDSTTGAGYPARVQAQTQTLGNLLLHNFPIDFRADFWCQESM